MISIFDLFKIGIGPSSSHTVGPMRAARMFLQELESEKILEHAATLKIELYGSLALTGRGHGTDRAVLLGLLGHKPDEVDPSAVEHELAAIRRSQTIPLLGHHVICFNPAEDLLFHGTQVLPMHSNGMRFTACNSAQQQLKQEIYYSVGGGFVVKEGATSLSAADTKVPFPFKDGEDLLVMGREHGKTIAEMVFANEKCWRSEEAIHAQIHKIWQVMQTCVQRGLAGQGELPGGLNVQRRAARLHKLLLKTPSDDPLDVMD